LRIRNDRNITALFYRTEATTLRGHDPSGGMRRAHVAGTGATLVVGAVGTEVGGDVAVGVVVPPSDGRVVTVLAAPGADDAGGAVVAGGSVDGDGPVGSAAGVVTVVVGALVVAITAPSAFGP
jgi:hypothetical protein